MATRIINDWRPEVSSLCERLQAAGFTLCHGDNGENQFTFKDKNLTKFVENLIACDEARLYISHSSTPDVRIGLYLVLGNDPGELVSDYGIPHDNKVAGILDDATIAHYTEW